LYGTPIEDTIYGSTNIFDFTMSEKTGKQWHVEWGGVRQQRTNRFYVSQKGAKLMKWKVTDKNERQYNDMLVGFNVQIYNNHENKPDFKDYNIDYRYYLNECRKIIELICPTQLKLF
jgi:hypothetical protein